MKTFTLLLLLFFAGARAANAQAQTTVTATVTDPNGIPYAGGTVKAQINPPGPPSPCVVTGGNCVPIQGVTGPQSLDSTGSFTMNLYPNASITPATTTWIFTVCISPGVPLPQGTGPQCFSVSATIAGASQSLSSALSAAAPALTHSGSIGPTIALKPQASDAIQYVSINGVDTNDGFSAGTAKGNADVATAIAAAIAALPAAGGTVKLLGGKFPSAASGINVPSNVCLTGFEEYATTIFFTATSSGINLPDGTTYACARDLTVEFSATASPASNGLAMHGVNTAIEFNYFKNIHIKFDALAAAGSAGIFSTTTGTVENALNRFENITVENAAQMIAADHSEGNYFDVIGQNLGANNSLLVSDTSGGNNVYNIRVEAGSSNGTPLTCFSTNSSGLHVIATCDSNQTETAVNDTGGNNDFTLSLVGTGSNISLGTIPSTSHWKVVTHNDSAVSPSAFTPALSIGAGSLSGQGIPTMGTCGTSPTITGTNNAFTVTVGTSETSPCIVNFGTPTFTNVPACSPTLSATGITLGISAVSATSVSIASSAAISSDKIYVHCF